MLLQYLATDANLFAHAIRFIFYDEMWAANCTIHRIVRERRLYNENVECNSGNMLLSFVLYLYWQSDCEFAEVYNMHDSNIVSIIFFVQWYFSALRMYC